MHPVHEWLLEGDPWTACRTRLDLLDEPSDSPDVRNARLAMISHPAIRSFIESFSGWDHEIVSSHKKADLLLHRLTFLADLGLTLMDPGMEDVARMALSHLSPEGVPQVGINIPTHFGGTGTDTWGWALCDTPAVLGALLAFGLAERPDLMPTVVLTSAIHHLQSLGQDNGWPCAVSPELGKFRGPGKKSDPCPDATLLMLKLLQQAERANARLPLANLDENIRTAADSLLSLWTQSLEQHPYMFYMGTDFRKLKAPFIWYDILHVADVLSRCHELGKNKVLQEMGSLILAQAGPDGRFTPQSVWKAWSDWDFGQKKTPSRWLTFLALRLAKRLQLPLFFQD